MLSGFKRCCACGVTKAITEFYIRRDSTDSLQNRCKVCDSEYHKKRHINYNKEDNERSNNYNKKHKKEGLIYQIRWRTKNRDKERLRARAWLKEHPEYSGSRRIKNPDYNKNYTKNRRATDINFKIACDLRGRLCHAIKNNSKSGSAVHDLGLPIEGFKLYLEGLFQPGMTWENYGRYNPNKKTWTIDHKIPLSWEGFDLTNRQDFMGAVHYSNLQPMWWDENVRKGSFYNGGKHRYRRVDA